MTARGRRASRPARTTRPKGRPAARSSAAPRLAPSVPPPGRDARLDVLEISLEALVPLRIFELRQVSETERMRLAREAADQVASHGDDILFRSARRGATATAFGWLVTGLAVAAFQPGGVRFQRLAWCEAHLTRRWEPGEKVCAACLGTQPPGEPPSPASPAREARRPETT